MGRTLVFRTTVGWRYGYLALIPFATSFVKSSADVSPSRQIDICTYTKKRGFYRGGLKRVFDTFLTLLALPIALPLIAAIALLICSSGGNPFYTQMRIGRDGRPFRIWKLRTMVRNADQCLTEFLEKQPRRATRMGRDAEAKVRSPDHHSGEIHTKILD